MQTLDLCRSCGGKASHYTKQGIIRDQDGEREGWITTCYCIFCGNKVRSYNDPMSKAPYRSTRMAEAARNSLPRSSALSMR